MHIYTDILTLIEPFVENKFVFQFIRKDVYKGIKFKNQFFIDSVLNGELDLAKFYLQFNPDVHYDEDYLFRKICGRGSLDNVKFLHSLGANVHAHDDNAFYKACKWGKMDLIHWLLQFNPNIRSVNDFAFIAACQNGHLEAVKLIVNQLGSIDILQPDRLGDAFFGACQNGHVKILDYLKQFDVLSKINEITNSYVEACSTGKMSVVNWYEQNNVSTTLTLDEYHEAFTFACFNGHLNMAKFLYNKYFQDSRYGYETHFCWAAMNGHLDVLKWLLEIDPRFLNNINQAFHYACECSDINVVKFLYSLNPSQIIDHLNTFKYTFVNVARKGYLHILEWLLIITDIGDRFTDMFMQACYDEKLEMAKFLHRTFPAELEKIVKSHRFGFFTHTCRIGNIELTKFLLQFNPDLHYQDEQPFVNALESGNMDYILWMYDLIQPDLSCFEKALFQISSDNNLDVVKWVLTKITPSQDTVQHCFVHCVQFGCIQIAKLFYKFKPVLTDEQKEDILTSLEHRGMSRTIKWLKSIQ